MTREDFKKFLKESSDGILNLEAEKAKEYDIDPNNRFEHFDSIAKETGVPTHKVLNIMRMKHEKTIQEMLRSKSLTAFMLDDWSGRIDDAILYLHILKGMVIANGAKCSGYDYDGDDDIF